jgi:hypothetical protein
VNFNFNFGNKKPDIKTYAIIGVVLTSIIAFLSDCTGIKEEVIWDLVDEVQREVKPGTIINDFIIKDPVKLERKIHRDVNRAIEDYERTTGDTGVVKLPSPIYIEENINNDTCYTEQCKSLGGPIRMCSPWVENCSEKTDK